MGARLGLRQKADEGGCLRAPSFPDLKSDDNEPAAGGAGELVGIGTFLRPAGSGKGGSWAAAGTRGRGEGRDQGTWRVSLVSKYLACVYHLRVHL